MKYIKQDLIIDQVWRAKDERIISRCWLNVSDTINEYLPYIKYYLTAI